MPDPYADEKPTTDLPADSDVDLHIAVQRAELRPPWPVLAVISTGGAIGSVIRWGIGSAFTTPAGMFPWATFAINVSGSLLIGALMVLVADVFTGRRLVRPFVGVGILGGYTTFSTYIIDSDKLINANAAGLALMYLAGTVTVTLVAAAGGIALTRFALRLHRTQAQAVR